MIPRSKESVQIFKEIDQKYPYGYYVALGLGLVIIAMVVGYHLATDKNGFASNILSELISVVFTVFVLDIISRHREERRQWEQLKTYLISQLGSQDNSIAINAAEQLRHHGWLTDGSLHGAYLGRADLRKAPLWEADLRGVNFEEADLRGADLLGADLRKVKLGEAKLDGANLSYANLVGVRWSEYLEIDEETKLPNGQKWTYEPCQEGIGLERFADPQHKEFWPPRKWGTIPPQYWTDDSE